MCTVQCNHITQNAEIMTKQMDNHEDDVVVDDALEVGVEVGGHGGRGLDQDGFREDGSGIGRMIF